jgi:predicted phage terminase large subunit-like protein
MSQMSPNIRDVLARVAKTDHFRWCQASYGWTWRKPMLDSPHLHLISTAIDKVMTGQSKRLLVNMPPRHAKTEQAVIGLSSRIMAVNPAAKIMHSSYGQGLVQKNSRRVLRTLGTPEYRECFPELQLNKSSRSTVHWETSKGGEFHAVSTKSEVTGFECGGDGDPWDGMLIIDDPEKASDVYSPTYRNSMKDVVGQMISTRLNHDDTPVIVIQQRLHQDDISNWLMSGGTGDVWTTLCLQAISQDGSPPQSYREYSHCDLIEYQRAPGALWPARRGEEALFRIRDAKEDDRSDEPRGARVFAAQYQQLPGGAQTALYDANWMSWYSETDIPVTMNEMIVRIDTAAKGKASSDHNGLVVIGADRRTPNEIFILDADHKRCEFPALVEWVADHCERLAGLQTGNLRLSQVVIEDANIGSALKTVLAVELKKRGVYVNITLTPSYGGKVQRAMEALPYFQAGQIKFPAERTRFCGDPRRDGQHALEVEYKTFSEADTHASDDILDCLVWEVVDRFGNAGGKKFAYGTR